MRWRLRMWLWQLLGWHHCAECMKRARHRGVLGSWTLATADAKGENVVWHEPPIHEYEYAWFCDEHTYMDQTDKLPEDAVVLTGWLA